MADGTSLINLGDLSKPVSTLIEKVSDAVGGIFKPYQIVRCAEAEAEAEEIRALSRIRINSLQERGLNRFIVEETKKQQNIESITTKAVPIVNEDATPQDIEDDWITNFFDKCRLISDEEMQILWSRILAGEANSPGSFSKRTINIMSSLDKADAILFKNLCSYYIKYEDELLPLVYQDDSAGAEFFQNDDINFESLTNLSSIGLICFNHLSSFIFDNMPKRVEFKYFETEIVIEFSNEKNDIKIGSVMFTKTGRELALICGSCADENFLKYIVCKLENEDDVISVKVVM